MWLTLSSLAHAGALGPGIPVKQVVPPPVVLSGVRTLSVDVQGPRGAEIEAELAAALSDTTRTLNVSGSERSAALVNAGTQLASAYVGGLVGGGLGGKAVSGLTKSVGAMVEEEIETEPLVLDDGLRLDVLKVVPAGGDATLAAVVEVHDEARDSVKKEPVLNEDGTFLTDANGAVVYDEIPCRAVSVTVSLGWTVTGAAGVLHQATEARSASDERCGAELSSLATPSQLSEPLLYGWGDALAAQLAPAWRHDRLPMDREPHLVEELSLVRAGVRELALCGLLSAADYDPADVAALLDAGVIHEAEGRLAEAEALYGEALARGADKDVAKAMSRVRERRAQVASMTSAWGLSFTPMPFDAAACPVMPEGRRVFVKKDAALATASGELPLEKGMRLFVLEEGDTLRVALLDGTEGTIEAKLVR